MGRNWALVIFALMLGGCDAMANFVSDKPEVAACKAFYADRSVSPSTMRVIGEPVIVDKEISLAEFKRGYNEPNSVQAEIVNLKAKSGLSIRSVGFQYEVTNAYGVNVRNPAVCEFLLSGGKLDSRESLMSDARAAYMDDQLADLEGAGLVDRKKLPERPKRKLPCCIR